MHGQYADLLTLRCQNIDRFFRGLGAGAHQNDHPLGIRRAGIIKQVILPPGQTRKLIHRLLHMIGAGLIISD